jgi:ubiquinone/menaquinone biosynthesis C-methylase UbiE
MSKPAPFLVRFLRLFFYLLYQPLAWSYDFVAWAVSLGRWKSWVYSVVPELVGLRVLELGHGPGYLQVAMRNRSITAFGADISQQMGHLAATKLQRVGYPQLLARAADQHLPYTSGAFDQLVATFPSEYILFPETLAEIRRVLRPGGSLVVLPVAWITGKKTQERFFAWLFRVTGQAGQWTGAFSQAISEAGFSVREKSVKLKGSQLILVIAERLA